MTRRRIALGLMLVGVACACTPRSTESVPTSTSTTVPTGPPSSTRSTIATTTTTAAPSPPSTYQALGAFDWIGGRIENDGYRLRLWVIGVGAFDPVERNPCTVEYFPSAIETEDEVKVSVTAERAEPTEPGRECPLGLSEQALVIDLAEPVGTREIFALGTYRDLVDIDDLTDLTDVIPSEWTITRDAPPNLWGTEPSPDWSRTWSPPGTPPPFGEPCDPVAVSAITLVEGPVGLHERLGTRFAVATTEEVAINASTVGTLFTESVGTVLQLNWRDGDRDYVLGSARGCAMDHPFTTADHLVELARRISP